MARYLLKATYPYQHPNNSLRHTEHGITQNNKTHRLQSDDGKTPFLNNGCQLPAIYFRYLGANMAAAHPVDRYGVLIEHYVWTDEKLSLEEVSWIICVNR